MWSSSSTKMMVMATSLSRARPLTCAASYPSRLVAQPVDLIKWVRREGGFVHHALRIALLDSQKSNGLGLGLGLMSSEDIPKGSDLIALPHHIPLRFQSTDGDSSALIHLARHVPGYSILYKE